jgi:hypothetical protein
MIHTHRCHQQIIEVEFIDDLESVFKEIDHFLIV